VTVCDKLDTPEDCQHIKDSIVESYNNAHRIGATAHGSSASGQTKLNKDGSVTQVSPYNKGEVLQSETYNPDGTIHYTTVNTETGVRHSHDVDIHGNVTNEHKTNQNLPVGHPDRH